MTRKLEKLSASGMRKFIDCPKQFWYYYLSEVEIPEGEEPEHFQVGNAVHESIENVLKDSPDAINNRDRLLQLFLIEEEQMDYEYSDDGREKIENCFESAAKYISTYVKSVNHVEEKWSMNRKGLEFTGLADLIADVDWHNGVKENVVVDWKTGSEQEEWKERLQGGTYVEMYKEEYGSYPEAIQFIYLDEGSVSTHKRVDDGKVFWNNIQNDYWEENESIISQIITADAKDEWPADADEDTCYFCDFKFVCSDYVGAEDVEPNQIEIQIPL